MKNRQPFEFNYHLSPRKPFQLMLMHNDHASAIPTRLDFHQAIHLGFLLRGSTRSVTRSQVYDVNEGDCYLIAPWEPHGILKRTAATILLISISEEELLRGFFTGGGNIRGLLAAAPLERSAILNTRELRPLLERFTGELLAVGEDAWTPLRQWNSITRFFIELDSRLALEVKPPEQNRLYKALELLHRSQGQMVSVEAAAAACRLGTSRFNHLFKDFFGIPFGAYELQYRLNGAAESLLHRNHAIKETALDWGFYDAAHFNRYFKKYFGMTPGGYQQAMRSTS